MQRAIVSLMLTTLSLAISYAIVAAWPDRAAVAASGFATQAASIVSQPTVFVPGTSN